MKEEISKKIKNNLLNAEVIIHDNSHMHSGNRTNSHFVIVVISDEFKGMKIIERHRKIKSILENEFNNIHSISLKLFTTDDSKKDQNIEYVKCHKKK